eukprot:gene13835-15281_t
MEEANGAQILSIIILTIFFGGFVLAVLMIFNRKKPESQEVDNSEGKTSKEDSKKEQDAKKKTAQVKEKSKTKSKEMAFSHPLLMSSLKGHIGSIMQMQFSACGKYLGSCSEDRTIRLWMTKDFEEKEHKYVRANVDLDHATSMSFSPDSRAFITSLAVHNAIRIFKINKKKEGSTPAFITTEAEDFPKLHKSEIISVCISSTGKFVMSASKDTTIIIWTLKGEVLATIDTLLVYNSCVTLSPSGALVAASGFSSDIKMWSVEFDKVGDFKQTTRALDLKGHSAGVHSFSFSADSKRAASISKDGSWKLWDIDVNYQKGQDAYLLHTGLYTNYFPGSPVTESAVIALSPDSLTVAIAYGRSIILLDVETKERSNVISDAHGDNINYLVWNPDSRQLASSGGGDRTVRVWHNPIGVKASLVGLKQKLLHVKSDSHKVS